MNLNSDDLKAIGELIDSKFDEKLEPIKSDIKGLKKDLGKVKKDLEKVKSNTEKTVDFLDKEILSNRNRIKRVENHLGLPPLDL